MESSGVQSSLGGEKDLICDRVSVGHHLAIPHTHGQKAIACKPGVSDTISDRLRVLTAIEFNDQPGLETDEVQHVPLERNLALELQSVQSTGSQACPKPPLRIGLIGSQPFRKEPGSLRNRLSHGLIPHPGSTMTQRPA